MLKKAQAKGDINHTLGYLTCGPGGPWLIFAGDRFNSGGTTYLDFELSKKAIVRVGNSDNGGFYSFGKDGGRTVGDLLVSVKFSKDFTAGKVTVYQWLPGGSSGFMYFPLDYSLNVIGAVNTTPVNVPYGAFGSTVYPPYTFAEFAIQLGIFSSNCSPAEGYRTARIQTRSNDSYGTLIDFSEATQLPINPDFSASVDYLFYDLQHAQLIATVTPGTVEDYKFFWLPITPLTGSLNDPNIYNPIFTAGAADYCLSYIYELYVYQKSDNCLVSITPVVINAPCKIGKPINPDRPNLTQNSVMEVNDNASNIFVYPNPSAGTATISFPADNISRDIELLDIKGSVTQRWRNIRTNNIQFNNVRTGLYLLKVTEESTGKVIMKKIVINK